jgi:hypothetical protein
MAAITTRTRTPREQVYKTLDAERDYQDRKWDTAGRNKPTECYMLYMESYLKDAIHDISHNAGDQGALDKLRKVVALGIACFEDNGIPERK